MTSRYKYFFRHFFNLMNSTKMDHVRKQVFETFGKPSGSGESFQQNLEKLISVMNKLTAEDVNLDKKLILPKTRHTAPVTYIEILVHPCFTINMFVLRPGSKLPLHDHPNMYGICKVVHGKVKISNYSLSSDDVLEGKRVIAQVEPVKTVSESDEAVLLTPKKGNIHEIRAVDGGAAFVDVLSPPYLSNIDGRGPRQCHYFLKLNSDYEGYVELLKVENVEDYWTDFAPYLGP